MCEPEVRSFPHQTFQGSRSGIEFTAGQLIDGGQQAHLGVYRGTPVAEDRVELSFVQAYSSDTYSDQVRKTLVMSRTEDGWRIVEERAQAL